MRESGQPRGSSERPDPSGSSASGPVEGARADDRAESWSHGESYERYDEDSAPCLRGQLRAVVSSTAAPYGYTLSLWSAGSLVVGQAGHFPSAVDIALFVAGAIVGFGVLAAVTSGGLRGPLTSNRARVRAWGGTHLPAVGISVLVSTALVHLLHGHVVWPLVGFGVTTVYLTLLAVQFWLASRPRVAAALGLRRPSTEARSARWWRARRTRGR